MNIKKWKNSVVSAQGFMIYLISTFFLFSATLGCGEKKKKEEEKQTDDLVAEEQPFENLSQPDAVDVSPFPSIRSTPKKNDTATSEATQEVTPVQAALAAPILLEPSLSGVITNTNSLTIKGSCETGTTVFITGSAEASCECVDSLFSFDIVKNEDGIFDFTFGQFNNTIKKSDLSSLQWVRDTKAPEVIKLATPTISPYFSGESDLPIAGSCESDAVVTLTEGDNQTEYPCQAGSFSINITKGTPGIFNFLLSQRDLSGNSSEQIEVTWHRSGEIPPSPTLTSPLANPFYTSSSETEISGNCADNYSVQIILKEINSQEILSTEELLCSGNSFSLNADLSMHNPGKYAFSIMQVNSLSGTYSASVDFTLVYDNQTPEAPIIENLASLNVINNHHTLSVNGFCEPESTLFLIETTNPDKTIGELCQAGKFSYNLTRDADGTSEYILTQKDLALNESLPVVFTWSSDTQIPSKPILLSPIQVYYISNNPKLSITGKCERNALVTLKGDDFQEALCTDDNFSFSIMKVNSQIYNFNIFQTDRAGNISEKIEIAWQLDQIPPSAPSILSPSSKNIISGGNSLQISASCEANNTVHITGDDIQSQLCQNQNITFTINRIIDGSYNFSIYQVDPAGNQSLSREISWQRDTKVPDNLVVISPDRSLFSSNSQTLEISGTCSLNNRVEINQGVNASEVKSPEGLLFQSCKDGTWNFSIEKTIDGTYSIVLNQINPNNSLKSGDTIITWIIDTIAPPAPRFIEPAINPYTSAANILNISGVCEDNALVSLSGSQENQHYTCQNEQFQFIVNRSVDATYTFTLSQTDLASNASPTNSLYWQRNTALPSTPGIIFPLAEPYYGTQTNLTIKGTCDSSLHDIILSGDILENEVITPSGKLIQTCDNGMFSFTISKKHEGTYHLGIVQVFQLTQMSSAERHLTWAIDTTAPTAPNVTSPDSSPFLTPGNFVIEGGCENSATVLLSGDDIQQEVCTENTFSFTVTKKHDGIYKFTLKQKDYSGNLSPEVSLVWQRDSSSIPLITLTSPRNQNFASNSDELLVSGSCVPSLNVSIAGDIMTDEIISPFNSFSQECPKSGTFGFALKKAQSGQFNLKFSQTNFTRSSPFTLLTWTIDKTAPQLILTEKPDSINLEDSATFSLSVDESSAEIYCSLEDDTKLDICSSSVNFNNLSNKEHIFYAYAIDAAGNKSSLLTYVWEQESYRTLALYHFNANLGVSADSSPYAHSFDNKLQDNGSRSDSFGKFAEGREFSNGASMNASNNIVLERTQDIMTVDGWLKLNRLPAKKSTVTLLSKSGGSKDLGWILGLRRGSSTFKLQFTASLDGRRSTTKSSNNFVMKEDTWYFFAVTWNKGEIKFFLNGSLVGITSIGSVGSSSLFNSSADLILGSGDSNFNGTFDEIRISQSIRYLDNFTVPEEEFRPD